MCSLSFCSKRLRRRSGLILSQKQGKKVKYCSYTVYVCSDHFTEQDDYTINPPQFGFLTSGETNLKFRRKLKRGVFPSIYPLPSEEQLVQKDKQFRVAKSLGISIPKTARASLASIKKDKSGERKIKRKHVFDKLAVSRVSTKFFCCGMVDTYVLIRSYYYLGIKLM